MYVSVQGNLRGRGIFISCQLFWSQLILTTTIQDRMFLANSTKTRPFCLFLTCYSCIEVIMCFSTALLLLKWNLSSSVNCRRMLLLSYLSQSYSKGLKRQKQFWKCHKLLLVNALYSFATVRYNYWNSYNFWIVETVPWRREYRVNM